MLLKGRHYILMVITLCLLYLSSLTSQAQLPVSQLFAFELSVTSDTIRLSKPRYLTNFNQDGYNNQPFFYEDEKLVVTSNVDDSSNTDLISCDLQTKKLMNITSSSWSEYSGKISQVGLLYYVCVNDEGDQCLCRRPMNSKDNPEIILPTVKNVGYFHLVGRDSVIVFRVNEPHELWLYALDGSSKLGLSRNIGRCFAQLNRREVAYVHKVATDKWTLRKMNLKDQTSAYIADMPQGVEDFVVLKDGRFLCAKSNHLLVLDKKGREIPEWEPIFDFSIWKIDNVSRLAINDSQSQLVIVDETH